MSNKKNSKKRRNSSSMIKERSWKNLLFKFIILASLGISAVIITDRKKLFPTENYYKMLSYKRWVAFDRMTENKNVDILLLGNSHLYNGINLDYLMKATGLQCFILADASINVKDNYYVLEEALKKCSPQLVILETFGLTHRSVDKGSNVLASIQCFDARENTWLKFKSMFSIFRPEDYLPAWSMTLRNHNRILESPEKIKETSDRFIEVVEKNNQPYYGEYIRYATGMTDSVCAMFDSLGCPSDTIPWEVSGQGLKYLRKIVELCEKKSIKVMLLTVPMYYASVNNYDFAQKRILKALSNQGIPWLDLQYPYDTTTFTPDCFEDNYDANLHMSYKGSILATDRLAKYIQHWNLIHCQ